MGVSTLVVGGTDKDYSTENLSENQQREAPAEPKLGSVLKVCCWSDGTHIRERTDPSDGA